MYLCLAFIIGISINSIVSTPQLFMLGFLVLGVFLISVFWKYKKLVMVGFCLLFLVLGIWRHQLAESEIIYPEDREITFVGEVTKEPDIRADNIKLTIGSKEIKGRVLVTVNRYPEYQYGDRLKIAGELKKPHIFENFNYRDYLSKDGIYSVMHYPQVELLQREAYRGPISVLYAKILGFKDKLRESIYRNLSPPQSSILGAMILGDKRRMSDELKEKLNVAGVRHITAISGMHIMILAGILMSLGGWLGLRRIRAFYLAMSFLALYIIMVGLPPSAVRAGIMGGLFLFSWALGRQRSSARPIVFAAALMLAQNPLLLRLDIGFQLSFLAVLGIIYLMPTFKKYLKNEIVAMTFSAYLFTLPILIYNFGYFSSVAPLTNVLIVSFLPLVMITGFVFGMAGIFWQPLGWILSWPSWLLLTYITKIVDYFSQISLASVTIENLHWSWLVITYLILGYITWRLNERQKLKLNY